MTENHSHLIDANDPRLTSFVLGELSPEESKVIQEAVAGSKELQAAVDEIRQVVAQLGDAYAAEESVELLADQKAEIVAATAASSLQTEPIPTRPAKSRGRWFSIAIAASLLGLMVAGSLYFAATEYSLLTAEKSAVTSGKISTEESENDLRGGVSNRADFKFSESDSKALAPSTENHPFAPESASFGVDAEEEVDEMDMSVDFGVEGAQMAGGGFGGGGMGAELGGGGGGRSFSENRLGGRSNLPTNGLGSNRSSPALIPRPASPEDGQVDALRFESGRQEIDLNEEVLIEALNSSEQSVQANSRRGQPGLGVPQEENKSSSSGQALTENENSTSALNGKESSPIEQQIRILDESKSREIIREMADQLDPDGRQMLQLKDVLQRAAEGSGDLEGREPDASENSTQEQQKGKKLEEIARFYYQKLGETEGKNQSGTEIDMLEKALAERNQAILKKRSWKRVKAIPNTSRLMVGEKDELDLSGMQVNVQLDGFRARVLVDYFYFNERSEQLEGNFKIRLPDDSSLYYFAFGQSVYEFENRGQLAEQEFDGGETSFVSFQTDEIRKARKQRWSNVKESRMVPREKAAYAYKETVRKKVDPALVEWSGAGVFSARVFPLMPKKLHRIVIGYDVDLRKEDGKYIYDLALPEQPGQCRVNLNVTPVKGSDYQVIPNTDPVEKKINGNLYRQYRFVGKPNQQIYLELSKKEPILLQSSNPDEGDYFAVKVDLDLPVSESDSNSKAIFLLDTSLSSAPDKFNVWLSMLKGILENNRDSIQYFNVGFFNVDTHFWKDRWIKNSPENVSAAIEACQQISLEGATDLFGALQEVSRQSWINEKTSPDLFLLSDGAANWGETNIRLIGNEIENLNFGSLFAYQSGLAGTAINELRFLASSTGGAVFAVPNENEIQAASTAHRKRPWKIENLAADGAEDLMTAGGNAWIYPGQTATIVGRGSPTEFGLKLTQGDREHSVAFKPVVVNSDLAARLYGQVSVGQLESLGEGVFDIASSYARHFRVTGKTCSLLMLETEQDYQRFGIQPEDDLFVIQSKSAGKIVEQTLEKQSDELSDPKAQLMAWLNRLETMPGMSFKLPLALKLAIEDFEISAISEPLDCQLNASEVPTAFQKHLNSESLDYDTIAKEANRRAATSTDDAIKVFSSLIERDPGNLELARDIAYTSMEFGRPSAAYHLLKRVAKARPFEGSIYPALGHCLTQLGQADQAMVYYEIAMAGKFDRTGQDFHRIVAAEYAYLLRQVVSGKLKSSARAFAQNRLKSIQKSLPFETSNLVITMLWNTDQTDVDLHVTEPNGEECSYENTQTRSGGSITADITTGFGPEMYYNPNGAAGKYSVAVKLFSNRQSRTQLRNKVHLSIYRGFGTDRESHVRKTIELQTVGGKEQVATIGVDKN
ncbi:MAG: hypothetical protein AAF623_12305 [Planctomycetota bacterium]